MQAAMNRELGPTRSAWHMLAEHVLSAARFVAGGRIGLQAEPGGFATPSFDSSDGNTRALAVIGGELVMRDREGERRTSITTLRDAGVFVGMEPGAPAHIYTPSTPLDLDLPLTIDLEAARELAEWFALTEAALVELCASAASRGEEPSPITLWPEHFDLATTIDEVNYGGSPGDAEHDEPYVYVGPWNLTPGEFWNEPFGASRSSAQIASAADAVAFFEAARTHLTG